MPVFQYKALDKKDKLISGTISATDEKEAESNIKDKHLKPLSIMPEKKQGIVIGGKKFSLNDKISLTRYMGLIIKSGMPVAEGLELLAKGTTNKNVKNIIEDIANSVRRGISLHDGFRAYEQYFNTAFLTMIKAGEASGTLAESFQFLADSLHKEKELKSKILTSMLYPMIIVGLMFVVGIIMFAFVLPRIGEVFEKMDIELPFFTRMLFWMSNFMQNNILLVAIVFVGLIVCGIFALKSKKGRSIFSEVLSRTPMIKRIILEYNLVRFTQSLSSLLNSGVPVTESVTLSTHTLSFVDSDKISKEFSDNLTKGVPLSESFEKSELFPPLMIQLITVGEKTGNLEETLSDLAEFYEEEVETSLKNFVAALEPTIMIFIGLAVGVMIFSVISPIYGMIGSIQGAGG